MNLKNILKRNRVNYNKLLKKMKLYAGERLLLTSGTTPSKHLGVILAGAANALIGSFVQPPNELELNMHLKEDLNFVDNTYVDSYTPPSVVDKIVAVIFQSVGLSASSALTLYTNEMLKMMKEDKENLKSDVNTAVTNASLPSLSPDDVIGSPLFEGLDKAIRRQKLRVYGHVLGALLNLPYGLRRYSYGSIPENSIYDSSSVIKESDYLPSLLLSMSGMAISSLDLLLTNRSFKKDFKGVADEALRSIDDLSDDTQKTIAGLALLTKYPEFKKIIKDELKINAYFKDPADDDEAKVLQQTLLFMLSDTKVEFEIKDPANPSTNKTISFYVTTDNTGAITSESYLSKDEFIDYFLKPLRKAMGG